MEFYNLRGGKERIFDDMNNGFDWLEENANSIDGDFYHYYHFGDIVVVVGYTSFDI